MSTQNYCKPKAKTTIRIKLITSISESASHVGWDISMPSNMRENL